MDGAMAQEDWERHFGRIWTEMDGLLRRSGAATAVLLDTSGNAVTYSGEDPDFDLSNFASLAVADYLATQEMAILLGQGSFRWVVHQGVEGGIVLAPLHPLLILAVLFDGRSTLGLVRHQVKKDRVRLEHATRPLLDLLEAQLRESAEEDGPDSGGARPRAHGDAPADREERDLDLDRRGAPRPASPERVIDDGLRRLFRPNA